MGATAPGSEQLLTLQHQCAELEVSVARLAAKVEGSAGEGQAPVSSRAVKQDISMLLDAVQVRRLSLHHSALSWREEGSPGCACLLASSAVGD